MVNKIEKIHLSIISFGIFELSFEPLTRIKPLLELRINLIVCKITILSNLFVT
jgi:hypothetical protein